jgi:hypothetical protein
MANSKHTTKLSMVSTQPPALPMPGATNKAAVNHFIAASITLARVELWCGALLSGAATLGPDAVDIARQSPEYQNAVVNYDKAVAIAYKALNELMRDRMYSDDLTIELAMRVAAELLRIPEVEPEVRHGK